MTAVVISLESTTVSCDGGGAVVRSRECVMVSTTCDGAVVEEPRMCHGV
jgi:hypothetical protein